MKKLSILLIGLLLVTGFAFAQDISGSASVTWGVDLNSNTTGFQNAASGDLTITLFDATDAGATGDDGLYGTITITDFSLDLVLDDSGAVTWDVGDAVAIEASITIDPATITIYSAPDFSMDMAPTIDSGVVEGDIATDVANVNGSSVNGITISVPAGPATVDVMFASDGDWTENVDNSYAVGTTVEVAVDPLTVDLGLSYGWFATADLGVSAGVTADVAPATVYVGFDGSMPNGGTFDYDLSADVTVDLSEANADDDTANVALNSYLYLGGTDPDVDVIASFTEPTDGGLADMVGASVSVELLDVVASLDWNVDVTGEYDTGDVKPYFAFGYGLDAIFDLTVGVDLYAGLTGIDNTTINLEYASTDLATDNGLVTVMAEVSL